MAEEICLSRESRVERRRPETLSERDMAVGFIRLKIVASIRLVCLPRHYEPHPSGYFRVFDF